MNTIVTGHQQLLEELQTATSLFVENVNAFNHSIFNKRPDYNRWSAAQVADHVTKSNNSIAKALLLNGKQANRKPDERIAELRSVFLNFDTKLKSPDFILPDDEVLSKHTVLATLQHSISKLVQIIKTQDLSVMINHPAFGDITKLEITYFVIFHTQRHTHQVQNIFRDLSKINSI